MDPWRAFNFARWISRRLFSTPDKPMWQSNSGGCNIRAWYWAKGLQRRGVNVFQCSVIGFPKRDPHDPSRFVGSRVLARTPPHSTGWGFHTAPCIKYAGEYWVIDPEWFNRPLRAREWANLCGGEPF